MRRRPIRKNGKTWVRGHFRRLRTYQGVEMFGFFIFLIALRRGRSRVSYRFAAYPLISWSLTVFCICMLVLLIRLITKK